MLEIQILIGRRDAKRQILEVQLFIVQRRSMRLFFFLSGHQFLFFPDMASITHNSQDIY